MERKKTKKNQNPATFTIKRIVLIALNFFFRLLSDYIMMMLRLGEKIFIWKRINMMVLSIAVTISTFSQTNNSHSKIDSLNSLLIADKEDTNKINHLNDLSWEYINIGQYDSAMSFGNDALQLAFLVLTETTSLDIKQFARKGIAVDYRYMGLIYFFQGDYPKSFEYHFMALKIDEELGNKNGIAKNLNNIGSVFNYQGDYPRALEYYFKSLRINEELENKNGAADNLTNIGNVYNNQGDYPKALEYYFNALKLEEKLGDKNGVAINFGNIANVYNHQGNYPMALEYYFNALKIEEKLGDKNGMAFNIGNIGAVYFKQGNYPKVSQTERNHFFGLALDYYFRALKINEELGNKNLIATNLNNIGEVYVIQKKYKEAEEYLLNAFVTSRDIGALELISDHHKLLSELYSQTNRYQLAYEHYKLYSAVKDSLFNEEKSKEIGRLEMQHEIEMTEMERERKATEELKIKTQKTERKNLLQYSGMVIGLIIIGLLVTLLGFIKVKPWVAEGITFFVFLLFFEFLLVLLDPYMDKFTKGEPAYKLFLNALVALGIFPLHAFFEKVLKKRLMKKK